MAALALIIGSILYRIPRGGPSREWWQERHLGAVSAFNEEIWATGTAGMIALSTGSFWPLLTAPLLWVGERFGYMHLVSDLRVRVWPLNLRGLLLANPFMGFIYAFWRGRNTPIWQPIFDGWTAWAELSCGIVTTAVYLIFWHVII